MSNLLRKAALSAIGGSLLVATLGFAPAAAERPDTVPADRQERAGGHGGASTGYTEDTDTNDGGTANNVVDDGDNMHPSGKDRSVEGGSGIQGASTSDPDDDGRGPDRSNGGPDKPNGAGGEDLADQDGNNGCGNDDDFEDDNEGWCGNKPKPERQARFASTSEPTTERKPCPNGSMTRPCGEAAAAAGSSCPDDEAAEADDADAMTAGCEDAEVEGRTHAADSAEHRADAAADSTCPAAEADDADEADDTDAMPAGCEHDDADTDADDAAAAGAAGEADSDDSDDTEVLGMGATRGGAAGAEVLSANVSAQSAGGLFAGVPVVGSLVEGELPMTGISTLSFLIFALAAMVIGYLLVRASRRTKVGATS